MNDVSVEKSYIASPYTDYVQSANTLFHFMDKPEYLINILKNQAIIPRYCIEDIRYLNIEIEGYKYDKIAVLQKCFCDIPLHKLTDSFKLDIVGGDLDKLTESKKAELIKNNSHPDYYGKYGIAFSKKWCEDNHLQPVQYINEKSDYAVKFSETIYDLLSQSDVSEIYVDDILRRISYIKPIRGNMFRSLKHEDNSFYKIEFRKNFHDEQEWRYIPKSKPLIDLKLNPVIANPNMLESCLFINQALMSDKYKDLWLKFKYDDIRYIIVPDKESRINIINAILDISHFETIINQYILISKILVLDEIRKDL